MNRTALVGLAVAAAATMAASAQSTAEQPAWAVKPLRAGIIGTDTSHVPAFAKIFHSRPEYKIRIVAAYKGGSPDLPISATRVDKFAATIQKEHGVELVESIPALLEKVDVVLLTSVDGRPHLEQATPVLKAGKPVFIDKPLAASLKDARAIVELSKKTGTPMFSSSSVRFHPQLAEFRKDAGVGKVQKVQANYVLNKIEFHPDLFFYGIHGVEALYAVMGPGCVSLTRKVTPDSDVSTCTWKDGRVGVYNALLKADPKQPLITVSGEKGTVTTSRTGGYDDSMRAVAEFFHTGRSPVDLAETIEVIEFMTAAELSKERNGAAVQLAELRK
jgi:predicted dehydrogenase